MQIPAQSLPLIRQGQEILLDDGKILCRVTEVSRTAIRAVVLRGGVLLGRKSIAFPGLLVPMPAMTEVDKVNIRCAKEYGVTGVMQPFVRSPQDLKDVRQELEQAGTKNIRLFAKIENTAGIEQIDALIPWADEIVIARGDLGNAVSLWDLPAVQKKIAAACRNADRDFMVVTQMLASMEHRAVPTRAEVRSRRLSGRGHPLSGQHGPGSGRIPENDVIQKAFQKMFSPFWKASFFAFLQKKQRVGKSSRQSIQKRDGPVVRMNEYDRD